MSPAPRRLLIVDDEQRIVDGLERVLRPHRASWEVTTATSPTAALAMMVATPFDVLVSDMRMPEMDGAALLALAKEKCPATARVILSGQTDEEAALRTVGVAHRFLTKPTEGTALLAAINRVVELRDQLRSAPVLAAVGRLDVLPSAPRLCQRLTALVSSEELSVKTLAAEIEQEPATTLKLLQLVNSSFFGLRQETTKVAQAVAYLGTDRCRKLVISLSLMNPMPARAREFDADAFQRRSVLLARLASRLGGVGQNGDTAFLAGLLLDVGKLALAFALPELYDDVARRARANHRSFEDEEAASGLCGHRAIAAYLLDLWGLPATVVEAIVDHARVGDRANTSLCPADALYLALRLVDRQGDLESDSDRAYVGRLGLTHRWPEIVVESRELLAS